MLKKMRGRFTGAAMAAFSTVIIILLCFVNVWNYQAVTRQQDETLNRLLEAENGTHPFPGNTPPGGTPEHFSPEVQYMIRFFSVQYDTQGNAPHASIRTLLHLFQKTMLLLTQKRLLHMAKNTVIRMATAIWFSIPMMEHSLFFSIPNVNCRPSALSC